MQNFNQLYITHLIGQDMKRIRHEVASLCHFSRVEQALSLHRIEQQTGGAVTAKQLDKIETEQKQKLNLDYLCLLARALNRRLQVTFIPIDETEKQTIPSSWLKSMFAVESHVCQSDESTKTPTQPTPVCSD